uniref:CCZ1/INTU/HSP4 first Longin domain-containing protein n=1 Tax=Graphocephala atropunctata TaxID=36148 RepID=A0A1B6LR64_9HEMI
MMSDQSELSLKHFYIFNEGYGKNEGEEEQKIMYYFPPKVKPDDKMKNVGLSEAIIQFTTTFGIKKSCESLHTEKCRHYYFSPEADFYIVMTVNVPTRSSVEGKTYHGEEVQDSVCQAVVKQAYLMYRLFHGTFSSRLDSSTGDTSPLKQRLELFFNRYLASMKLHHCDIMDVFQGVQFLPLDKTTFLHIQCFVNLLEASFPVVEFTAFLYNDRLIWSGLEPEDMQVVFHYLVYTLLPKSAETELTNGSIPTLNSYGRFLTGPENVHSNSNNVGKVPKLFLSHVKISTRTFHIVVYRMSNCTVCLFIPESEQLTMEMFRKWDTFLGPRLTKLVAEVSSYASKQSSTASGSMDAATRFVYFNRMNLATKSTVHLDSLRSGNTVVTPQVLRLLADINAEHTRSCNAGNPSAETIVKTMSDYWVVGRLSNAREFYVVIQHKNANLIEISDEVKRICDNELKSIFFHV